MLKSFNQEAFRRLENLTRRALCLTWPTPLIKLNTLFKLRRATLKTINYLVWRHWKKTKADTPPFRPVNTPTTVWTNCNFQNTLVGDTHICQAFFHKTWPLTECEPMASHLITSQRELTTNRQTLCRRWLPERRLCQPRTYPSPSMKFRLKLVQFVRKKTTRLIEVSVLQLFDKCVSLEKDGWFKSFWK